MSSAGENTKCGSGCMRREEEGDCDDDDDDDDSGSGGVKTDVLSENGVGLFLGEKV